MIIKNFSNELEKLDNKIDNAIYDAIEEKGDDNFIEIPTEMQAILGGKGNEFFDSVHWFISGVGIDLDGDLFAEGVQNRDWQRLSVNENIKIYAIISKL